MIHRILSAAAAFLAALAATAQTVDKVGVDTRTPTEVLDVNGTARVRQLPKVGSNTIFTTSAGTSSATANQPFAPKYSVVADAHGVLGTAPHWFYMPSVVLPIDPSKVNPPHSTEAGGTYSVDLYALYSGQFAGGTDFSNRVSSSPSAALTTFAATDFDYFVTYYDAAVFDQVAVTASGILSYRLKSDFVVSERTYMNIVLQVKE